MTIPDDLELLVGDLMLSHQFPEHWWVNPFTSQASYIGLLKQIKPPGPTVPDTNVLDVFPLNSCHAPYLHSCCAISRLLKAQRSLEYVMRFKTYKFH